MFFREYTSSKIRVFTNYTIWQSSHFHSTDRVDPDGSLEMKMEKEVPLTEANCVVLHIPKFGDTSKSPEGDTISPAGDAASPSGDAVVSH